VAFANPPVELAANLAHEATHQYYFLLRAAGRTEDGSDTNLYYSSFVKQNRDLNSIVLSYHAFANEALFARTCELNGIKDPAAGERAEFLRKNLLPLEEILLKTTALTPLGRGLWAPVYKRLQDAYKASQNSNIT
jgi:HEXXH motif-containing protein